MMDDLGYDDLGIHGNSIIKTPVIDSLARNSIRFTNFYVNPVCAPSRASLLTGRHFLKTGVSHVHGGKDFLNLNEKTMADVFSKYGYHCGIWGKWHSGKTDGYFPWQRGFEEAFMAKLYQHNNCEGVFNGTPLKTGMWADEAIVDMAIEFIRKYQDAPFLAYLSFLSCHSPLNAREELIQEYKRQGLSENLSILYAMINQTDKALGSFFRKLDSLDLENPPVVLFMSDNGPAIGSGTFTEKDRRIRNHSLMRGHKGNLWENGVRSPLFISKGKRFKPSHSDELTDITDILPTMMDLAGIPLPSDFLPLDGISFRSVLEGKPSTRGKTVYNYADHAWLPNGEPWTPEGQGNEYKPLNPLDIGMLSPENQVISIREGEWKLIRNDAVYPGTPSFKNGMALIRIGPSHLETTNLTDSFPGIAEALNGKLYEWFEEIRAEPGAFKSAVFLVGSDPVSIIPAYGCSYINGGLRNGYMFLSGWESGTAYASYRIRVVHEGRYRIGLKFRNQNEKIPAFRLRTKNNKAEQVSKAPVPEWEIDLNPSDAFLFLESTSKVSNPVHLVELELQRILNP